jgi:hypothetical protein
VFPLVRLWARSSPKPCFRVAGSAVRAVSCVPVIPALQLADRLADVDGIGFVGRGLSQLGVGPAVREKQDTSEHQQWAGHHQDFVPATFVRNQGHCIPQLGYRSVAYADSMRALRRRRLPFQRDLRIGRAAMAPSDPAKYQGNVSCSTHEKTVFEPLARNRNSPVPETMP